MNPSQSKPDSNKIPRFLAYELPAGPRGGRPTVKAYADLVVHCEPLRSSVSFLDFDGVILFAGAFEEIHTDIYPRMACKSVADLDRRRREFFSAVQQGIPIIFLIPAMPHTVGHHTVSPTCDLFRTFTR